MRMSMEDPHGVIKQIRGNGKGLNINELLIRTGVEQSERFIADESWRARYHAKHRTEMAALKCMDGREHLPTITRTPTGIVKPYRAIGARFDLGMPAFTKRLTNWIKRTRDEGRHNVVLVTYHCSASDPHLGCAGWNYDTNAAQEYSRQLAAEIQEIIGEQGLAILTEVETDQDALTMWGPSGRISGRDLIGANESDARLRLHQTFHGADVHEQILDDLLPFLMGNALHVDHLQQHPRSRQELEHNERVIAVGQCFDWLAAQNTALIINDSDWNLDEAIATAGRIMEKNLLNAPSSEQATLFTCIPYSSSGMDRRQAMVRSRKLQAFARRHLSTHCPKLWNSGRLMYLTGIVFEPDRRLEVLEQGLLPG